MNKWLHIKINNRILINQIKVISPIFSLTVTHFWFVSEVLKKPELFFRKIILIDIFYFE